MGVCFGGCTALEKARATAALLAAAKANDSAAALRALAGGADIAAEDAETKFTALHYFAAHGDLKTVCTLIKFGAGVDARAAGDETPIVLAARTATQAKDIVRLLAAEGADMNGEPNLEGPLKRSALDYWREISGEKKQEVKRNERQDEIVRSWP